MVEDSWWPSRKQKLFGFGKNVERFQVQVCTLSYKVGIEFKGYFFRIGSAVEFQISQIFAKRAEEGASMLHISSAQLNKPPLL